ncbi:MAG: hypothetical protein AAFR38_14850 [Planctomycetota bacterium]
MTNPLKIRALALAAGIALTTGAAAAQSPPPLSTSGTQNLTFVGPGPQDFTIPNLPGAIIRFTVAGADGGDVLLDNASALGGEGASITIDVNVGSIPGEIRPGGRIRFIIGEAGEDNGFTEGGAAGGGGSGILYEADAVGDDWIPVAVAGAGGGAYIGAGPSGPLQLPGKPALTIESGSDGGIGATGDAFAVPGAGGQPGDAGEFNTSASILLNPGAGGAGLFGSAVSPNPFSPFAIMGYPSGGPGSRVNSRGGWGCGGGGGGGWSLAFRGIDGSGGGGGGYSGGGGGGIGGEGGGGGSLFASTVGTGVVTLGNNGTNGSASYRFLRTSPPPVDAVDLGIVAQADRNDEAIVEMTTRGSNFDTVIGYYSESGELLFINDDISSGERQSLMRRLLTRGTYYLFVSGWPNFPTADFGVLRGQFQGFSGNLRVTAGNTTVDSTLAQDEVRFYRFEVGDLPQPCGPADFAQPFGVISQADVDAFVNAFFAGDPAVAALAPPFDAVSQTDVTAFVNLFFAGCPTN